MFWVVSLKSRSWLRLPFDLVQESKERTSVHVLEQLFGSLRGC
jgi:hypothetical protein